MAALLLRLQQDEFWHTAGALEGLGLSHWRQLQRPPSSCTLCMMSGLYFIWLLASCRCAPCPAPNRVGARRAAHCTIDAGTWSALPVFAPFKLRLTNFIELQRVATCPGCSLQACTQAAASV